MNVSGIDVLSIPGRVRKSLADWDGSVCMQYLYQILDWLYRTVSQDSFMSVHYDGSNTFLSTSNGDWAKFTLLNQAD